MVNVPDVPRIARRCTINGLKLLEKTSTIEWVVPPTVVVVYGERGMVSPKRQVAPKAAVDDELFS